jgi:hypothetical protein
MPLVIIASMAELLLLLVTHTFLLPAGLPGGDILGDIRGISRLTGGRLTSASLINRGSSPVA